MAVIGVVAGIVAVLALLFAFVLPAVTDMLSGPKVESGQQVEVSIPDGATGDAIASKLAEQHVIDDPSNYYAAVKKLEAEMSIKPGDYLFTTGQDPVEVVEQLVEGPNNDSGKLTVPEGLTVFQTAAKVEETLGIPAKDFIAQATVSNYKDDYAFLADVPSDSLEGYLCPKTYSLGKEPTADSVVRAMLDQYQAELKQLDFESGRAAIKSRFGVELSNYEIMNLASIVEREGLYKEQREHVAAVFLNRLAGKMPGGLKYLNSDATMMYVTGGAVTADDLKKESPYNSYKEPGLPPTPICSPSLESIQATLNPTDSNDLYFYITQDEEFFSETYDEHMQSWE